MNPSSLGKNKLKLLIIVNRVVLMPIWNVKRDSLMMLSVVMMTIMATSAHKKRTKALCGLAVQLITMKMTRTNKSHGLLSNVEIHISKIMMTMKTMSKSCGLHKQTHREARVHELRPCRLPIDPCKQTTGSNTMRYHLQVRHPWPQVGSYLLKTLLKCKALYHLSWSANKT